MWQSRGIQARTIEQASKRLQSASNVVLLMGAGCSKAAGIPLGSEIVDELKQHGAQSSSLSYSAVVRATFPSAQQRNSFFESKCAGKSPTKGHKHLAEHITSCKLILTTNFDMLLEKSFQGRDVDLFVLDAVDEESKCKTFVDRFKHGNRSAALRCVVKLHGTYTSTTSNTYDELEKVKGHIVSAIMSAVSSMQAPLLVVLGYSGGDRSIETLIKTVFNSEGSVMWVASGPPSLDELTDFLCEKKAIFVDTNGAFFDDYMTVLFPISK